MKKEIPLNTLEEAREFFKNDRFATENGAVIESVEERHSVISLSLNETHMNAAGGVMGGVMFMMSDFACAVAANFGPAEGLCVSVDSHISFIGAVRGGVLTAEALCVKPGRNMSFYEVTVKDDLGTLVAKSSFTMFRVRPVISSPEI